LCYVRQSKFEIDSSSSGHCWAEVYPQMNGHYDCLTNSMMNNIEIGVWGIRRLGVELDYVWELGIRK